MYFVDDSEARGLITPREALDLARATLVDQEAGGSVLSAPSAMALDATVQGGPKFKFKAAVVGHMGVSGVRLLARMGAASLPRAENVAVVYDHDAEGAILGMVSEHWLSRIRTAAFGVAGVEGLLPDRSLRIGLFGAGDIAAEIVPIFSLAFDVRNIRVRSRRFESAQAFAARQVDQTGLDVRAVETDREVVEDSDLIVTLTEATEPLVRAGWMGSEAVLVSMGSHNEVEFDVLGEAERFVVDDPDYASEMGDGGAWVRDGKITKEEIAHRVDLRASRIADDFRRGVRQQTRRTVALIQGMAIGDIAFAAHVLRSRKT